MRVIRIIIVCFIISFFAILNNTSLSAAGKGDFGAGIILGEPTGISLKYKNFPVVGIAWSLENHFHLHCDYWIHNGTMISPVKWFIGVGGKFVYFSNERDKKDKDSEIGLGVRVPVGIQYFIIDRVELFAEVAPGISLIPSTDFDIDGGIGVRYYF